MKESTKNYAASRFTLNREIFSIRSKHFRNLKRVTLYWGSIILKIKWSSTITFNQDLHNVDLRREKSVLTKSQIFSGNEKLSYIMYYRILCNRAMCCSIFNIFYIYNIYFLLERIQELPRGPYWKEISSCYGNSRFGEYTLPINDYIVKKLSWKGSNRINWWIELAFYRWTCTLNTESYR